MHVQEVPNLLFLAAAMVLVSGGASGVIEDPNRFLPLILRSGSACCVRYILEDECEKFCNVSILLLFFHRDNIPSIRPPPPHTMILWGAIRLELVRSVHKGVMVDNSKKNTACVATITENSTSIILCVLW